MATKLAGTFTETSESEVIGLRGRYNLSISGTFEGSALLQRTFDDGVTWDTVDTFTSHYLPTVTRLKVA